MLVNESLQMRQTNNNAVKLSTHLHKLIYITHIDAFGLPMNRCSDDTNVTIDFSAVSKGLDVCGID